MTTQDSKQTILIVGSSIFQQWSDVDQTIDKCIIKNRAIGGTITSDWLENLDAVLKAEKPAYVWFYCGSNDFNQDIPIQEIISNTFECRRIIQSHSPKTKLAYFSIMKAPQKEPKWQLIDEVNKSIKSGLEEDDLYIETNHIFFEHDPAIQDYFVEDGLHLTNKAYKDLSAYVQPHLLKWMSKHS